MNESTLPASFSNWIFCYRICSVPTMWAINEHHQRPKSHFSFTCTFCRQSLSISIQFVRLLLSRHTHSTEVSTAKSAVSLWRTYLCGIIAFGSPSLGPALRLSLCLYVVLVVPCTSAHAHIHHNHHHCHRHCCCYRHCLVAAAAAGLRPPYTDARAHTHIHNAHTHEHSYATNNIYRALRLLYTYAFKMAPYVFSTQIVI